MLGRLERSNELAVVRHTVQVTSFGGSGTTALADHLLAAGVDLPATPGYFPFKHQRIPPRVPPTCPRASASCTRSAIRATPSSRCSGAGSRAATTAACRLRRPPLEVEQRLASLGDLPRRGRRRLRDRRPLRSLVQPARPRLPGAVREIRRPPARVAGAHRFRRPSERFAALVGAPARERVAIAARTSARAPRRDVRPAGPAARGARLDRAAMMSAA